MVAKKNLDINFAENPDSVDVGDWVFCRGKVGRIQSIAKRKANFLQFWVQFEGEKGVEPEMASSLKKIEKPVNFSELKPTNFLLESLTIDEKLQQRVKLNQSVIDDYAQAYADGQELPPIITWWDTEEEVFEKIYLVDGFHRVEGAKIAGLTELPHIQKQGTFKEALLFSMSVNSTHGLRRTNADKRKAVLTLLDDKEWKELSTRELAKIANVSHQLVHNIREEIAFMEKELEEKQQTPEEILKEENAKANEKEKEKEPLSKTKKSLPPDVRALKKKDSFAIEIQKPTLDRIKKFIDGEKIVTAETAITRLIEEVEKLRSQN